MNPFLSRLGLTPEDRALILHADDVGLCHGANLAFIELARRGLVTCGSVMAPCPGFAEAAELARETPGLDLGVHLTLTSEWDALRWGPISTRDPTSGLLDEDGAFYHRTPRAWDHMDPGAAAGELRAQVDAALAAGIAVTHLDAHMGVTFSPALLEVYAALGREYRLPVLLPRQPAFYYMALGLGRPDGPAYAALVERLEGQGMPVVDRFFISPGGDPAEYPAIYRELIGALQPGLTFFSLHPNAPGDIERIAPSRAAARIAEYHLLQDPSFIDFVSAQNIKLLGYRTFRDFMRQ